MRLCLLLTVCVANCLGSKLIGVDDTSRDRRWGGSGRFIGISRRNAGTGAADIYQQVRDTLDRATQGITAADLEAAAESIQISADAYVDNNGGAVAELDLVAAIDEVAATFNGAVAVSALFDTPLIFEASLLDSAFCLWEGLVEKAEQLEAAGESPTAVIAAISLTATSVKEIAVISEGIIIHQRLEKQEGIDVPPEEAPARRKRWEVKGEVEHGPEGTSGKVSVGHSWKRSLTARAASQGVGGGGGRPVSWRLSVRSMHKRRSDHSQAKRTPTLTIKWEGRK